MRYSVGNLHDEQSGHGGGAAHRGPSGAAIVRSRSADRVELRRPGDVPLLAGRGVPPGGGAVRVYGSRTPRDCGERLPLRIRSRSPLEYLKTFQNFMQQRISPASAITAAITLPGDKSISHRYAMISAIADGESRIHNYSTGADCHSTLGCVRALGIEVEVAGTEVLIKGRGLDGLRAPMGDLDAGNSGSTIRMLSGILAAQPFVTRIFGDESLSRRPMQRIMRPLAEMGAQIRAREDKFPPLEIHSARLRPIDYTLPVPSAQVKTSVLFAGLFAEGQTSVSEPVASSDHTEIALREFGADLTVGQPNGQRRSTLAGC